MLTAAMVFGLLGGVAYLTAGLVAALVGIPVGDTWTGVALVNSPLWMVVLIPVGAAGIVGAALGRWKPTAGGILLWLASGALVVMGLVSAQDVLRVAADSPLSLHNWEWLIVVVLLLYFIGALLALMVGGTLALVGRAGKATAAARPRAARAKRHA